MKSRIRKGETPAKNLPTFRDRPPRPDLVDRAGRDVVESEEAENGAMGGRIIALQPSPLTSTLRSYPIPLAPKCPYTNNTTNKLKDTQFQDSKRQNTQTNFGIPIVPYSKLGYNDNVPAMKTQTTYPKTAVSLWHETTNRDPRLVRMFHEHYSCNNRQ